MGKYADGTFGGMGKSPIVKSGPTYGLERSRNKGGEWRAKRSDTGITRK
ncbi:hypothetical protein V7161_26905 [Neobacillus drentensis]